MKGNLSSQSCVTAIFIVLMAISCSCENSNSVDDLDPAEWAPADFTVTDVSITEKKLSWSYEDFEIDGFKLDRKKGEEEWQQNYQVLPMGTRNWNDDDILPDGSTYHYKLYAYAGSNISENIVQTSTAILPAPSELLLTIVSQTSVRLDWKDNSNGEEGFGIDRKISNGDWQTEFASVSSNINTYIDNSVNLNTNKYYYRIYAFYTTYHSSYSNIPGSSFECGDDLMVIHDSGAIAPVTKTVIYGTVSTSLSGSEKCWITQNLGADHQAPVVNDYTEASAGWYWQFNRKQGYKHDLTTRTPNTTWISPINENSDWQAANDPCTLLLGNGWRLPSYTEWYNADANGEWNNYTDTYNSVLKLHPAGSLFDDGSLNPGGFDGNYWSSSQYDNSLGGGLHFHPGSCYVVVFNKAYGLSIRCIRD